MNIRDISKPVTAASLNESLEKKFGKKIRLEDFSLEQLQNARNKLRTSLSQIETNESYGAVNTSESYQKNKLFLDVLNAEISERGSVEVNEKAESEAQQKAAGAALAAKRGEISKSELTGASLEMLNMSEKDLEDFAGTKHSGIPAKKGESVEEGSMDMDMDMAASDGRGRDNVPPEDENDLDYEGGMAMKQLSTIDDAADELTDLISTDENLPEWVQKKIILAMSYIDTARDYMKSAGDVDRDRGMSMESVIREGAEDRAEIVMAAKNMVDKITSWMEDTGEMQTESMLDLADSIRDELGEQESEQFTTTVKPSLESLYTALEDTRKTLVTGVRLVAGEEVEDMPGDDMDAGDELDMEPTVDQEDDIDLNAPDEEEDFASADAAAGGEEEAGREKRESINRSRRFAQLLSSKKK